MTHKGLTVSLIHVLGSTPKTISQSTVMMFPIEACIMEWGIQSISNFLDYFLPQGYGATSQEQRILKNIQSTEKIFPAINVV